MVFVQEQPEEAQQQLGGVGLCIDAGRGVIDLHVRENLIGSRTLFIGSLP